jgi:hypothetical protein
VGETAVLSATLTNENVDGATVRLAGWQPVLGGGLALNCPRVLMSGELFGGQAQVLQASVAGSLPGTCAVTSVALEAFDVNSGLPVALGWNRVAVRPQAAVGLPPVARLTSPISVVIVDGRPIALELDASASFEREGAGPLSYAWSCASGLPAALTPGPGGRASVELGTRGGRVFRVEVTDSLGLSAWATAGVEAFANSSPSIVPSAPVTGLTFARIPVGATAVDTDGDAVAYRWQQEGGPGTLTFVSGDLQSSSVTVRSTQPGDYRLRLTASDPRGGLSTATVELRLVPAPVTSLTLGVGANLVSLAVAPLTTDGHLYDASDLSRDCEGAVVARVGVGPSGTTQFLPFLDGLGKPFAILPGEGYVVLSRKTLTVTLPGQRWPAAAGTVITRPPLVLLGYPLGPPAGETAQSLLGRTGARYVARTRVDASGRSVLELHVPGLTQPFAALPGEGYLLTVGRKGSATLPGQ